MMESLMRKHDPNISTEKHLAHDELFAGVSATDVKVDDERSRVSAIADREWSHSVRHRSEHPFSVAMNSKLSTSDEPARVPSSVEPSLVNSLFGRGRGTKTSAKELDRPSLAGRGSPTSMACFLPPELNRRTSSATNHSDRCSSHSPPEKTTSERKFKFSHRLSSTTTDQQARDGQTTTVERRPSETLPNNNERKSLDSDKSFCASRAETANPAGSRSSSAHQPETAKPRHSMSDNDSTTTNNSQTATEELALAPSESRCALRQENQISTRKVCDASSRSSQQRYTFRRHFNDVQLSYILGPGQRLLTETDRSHVLPYLPSGYCLLTGAEQGKDVEKRLYSILPTRFNIELVQTEDHLALLTRSSAAEYVFEQMNIEVIREAPVTSATCSLQPSSDDAPSPTKRDDRQPAALSDGKLHISKTNSSIDVVSGDISQVPVDLMICISTSNNLRDSVLRCAGQQIEAEFRRRYVSGSALLLDGGATRARKILFVPWVTEIKRTNMKETQQSMSDLVTWCIDQAHQRNMQSISFPPFGTGQLGLDPGFVCEAMMNAASESLRRLTTDVVFVIYPSNTAENDASAVDECYQVFRIYLDSLCEQMNADQNSTTTTDDRRTSPERRDFEKQLIRRDAKGRRILTLSDAPHVQEDHKSLVRSLEALLYSTTVDLNRVEPALVDQVDSLVEVCVAYNVVPRIDYAQQLLKLSGDRESCLQCCFNLVRDKSCSEYSYRLTRDSGSSHEVRLCPFVSLKIDEAVAADESNVLIEDDDRATLTIDVKTLRLTLGQSGQSVALSQKPINPTSKVESPSTGRSSPLTIRWIELQKSEYERLEWFPVFSETLPPTEWQIQQIDSVENRPLLLHATRGNDQTATWYFHGCPYSSVQSVIHYGLHSTNASTYVGQPRSQLICLTRDARTSHLHGTRRSTDGKHFLFVVRVIKDDAADRDSITLTNEEARFALPSYLITYRRKLDSP